MGSHLVQCLEKILAVSRERARPQRDEGPRRNLVLDKLADPLIKKALLGDLSFGEDEDANRRARGNAGRRRLRLVSGLRGLTGRRRCLPGGQGAGYADVLKGGYFLSFSVLFQDEIFSREIADRLAAFPVRPDLDLNEFRFNAEGEIRRGICRLRGGDCGSDQACCDDATRGQ